MDVVQEIEQAVLAVAQLKEPDALAFIASFKERLVSTFKKGHKVLIAGNGGSLCDAIHFAEELTGFYRKKRAALPAIALSDPGHVTCVGNDIGFEHIYARSIEALGKPFDLFIALSTSGNSKNLIHALRTAREKGLYTVSLLGRGGGQMGGLADIEWSVPKVKTSDRIQEAHMTLLHIVIGLVEETLFTKEAVSQDVSVESCLSVSY